MNCKLEITYEIDVNVSSNNIFIVRTEDPVYGHITGRGLTVEEAINDFDAQCEEHNRKNKCA